jgi:hypothetical protein
MRKVLSGLLVTALIAAVMPEPGVYKVNAEAGQVLFINEVMAANTDTLRDGDVEDPDSGSQGGAYSDWIELYNSGDQAINLEGYTLSDSSATWKFPTGTVPAKGYLLVWASDKNKVAKDGQLHSNFKISSSGEALTLRTADGSVVDTVTTVALKDNESYGRKTDGSQEWVVFSQSTPLKENVFSPETVAVKDPVFSHKGGFYTSAFELRLTSDEAGINIYYTLDGSDPVPGAEGTIEYQGPITVKSRAGDPNVISMISNISSDPWDKWKEPVGELFKCTTIRAVAVRENGKRSRTITNSFFVDKDMKTRYNLPVISLVTDPKNLFDDTDGIYVNENYEKKGDEWERPVHIEFFEKDGTLAFSQNSGLRINGGASRKIPQKSFRLYADHGYDDSNKYKYEVFPGLKKRGNGKKLDSFSRLVLRNAGNDYGWTGAMFRDGLMQGLVSHLKLDTLAFRPSVVFLDGEYWGIYNIRERYDGEYLESHYNLDKDKAVILDVWETPEVQQGSGSDWKLYSEDVIDYLKANSITDEETYNYIKTKIDIENYINYNVAEIFFGNYDWPGNNTTIWKYKTDDGGYHPEAPYGLDGRWRWMLRDTDFGFGLYQKSVDFDTLAFATADVPETGVYAYANAEWAVFLLKTLLKNTEFRNQFINTFADQLNTSFDPVRVNKKVDELKAGIEAAMPEHVNRWRVLSLKSTSPGELTWYDNIQTIKSYANNRPSRVRQHILKKFKEDGVTGTTEINVNTDTTQGYVRINSIDIKSSTPGVTDPANWSGIYFKGVPVTLKAIPEKGYKFDRWEGVEGIIPTSESITFNPDENINIRAVFKPDGPAVSPTPADPAGFKISGYVNPDLVSSFEGIKEGFKVEVVGKDIQAFTDSKGYFELKGIPENSTGYSIKISKANYLYREIKNIAVTGDMVLASQHQPIVIWAGDMLIDGAQDNVINILDIMKMAMAFNTVSGDEKYNPDADLNKDNCVNIVDIMSVAKHFNTDPSSYK